ncbi:hypothetical protein ART_1205 [Arthrobacter sp. PAMC 25486]|nr:hypothetical protein ART_1205 [Arthrobacter sp. PAMC 25486]
MKQLRVGLIGAGGIAGVHIAGWQHLGAHITIYSRSGAADLVREYGIDEVRTLDALLAASDMVSILTPTPSHHHYAMAAIAAGKDVICEKPLAENTARSVEIANAARAADVRIFPAHVVRFFPEYVAAKSDVEQGTTHTPAVLRLSRSSAGPADGSWFYNEGIGGGIIHDQMIHDIDQARWLAGEVAKVHAVQNPPSVDGILPRPVTAAVTLTHESGAVSHLRGEWGPDSLPFSTSISIEATDGTIVFARPAGKDGPAAENEPGDYLPVQAVATSPYTLQNAEFAAAHSSGAPARVTAYDGVMAVALAEAAYASIALGAPVDFSAAEVKALLVGGELPQV